MKRLFCFLLLVVAVTQSVEAQFICKNWEKIENAGPGLKLDGWIATPTSKEIISSPWSVGCETVDRDYTVFENYKGYLGQLGVKSARLQGGWAKCEKQKGVYDFLWLDSCVYGLARQRVQPWICLSYGNPLYGSDIRLGAKIFSSEEAMTAWIQWVKATVSRYKNVVKEWEIWNEPNSSNKSQLYADLLIKTAEAIKEVQPDAEIIGFSLAGVDLKFAKGVLEVLKARHKLDIVDYLTYHPYSFNPDASYQKVDTLMALVKSYNPAIKLFQGENGAPSDNHYVYHALRDYPWTEISQAKWYMRRMAGDRVRNIRSNVFSIIDMRYPEVLLSMGLLRSNLKREVIYKKPAFYAVQHMAGYLDNTLESIGTLPHTCSSTRETTIAGFSRAGTSMVLVWYSDKIPSDDLQWEDADLSISGVKFKDPVYVEMISGKVYDMDRSNWNTKGNTTVFHKLPLWDSVIMIAERTQVSLRNDKNR